MAQDWPSAHPDPVWALPTCSLPTDLVEGSLGTLYRPRHLVAALWPSVSRLFRFSFPGRGLWWSDFPLRNVCVIAISPEQAQLRLLAWFEISGPHLLPPPQEQVGAGCRGCARIQSEHPAQITGCGTPQTPQNHPLSLHPTTWPQIKLWPQAPHLLFPLLRAHPPPMRSPCPPLCLQPWHSTHMAHVCWVPTHSPGSSLRARPSHISYESLATPCKT